MDYCPRCGAACPEAAARFCPSCGAVLAERGQRLEGARCAAHPERPASEICVRCGAFACAECARPEPLRGLHCAACVARLRAWVVPWEHRAERGRFRSYWATMRAGALSPDRSLANLPAEGRWWDALSYAMVSYGLGIGGTLLLYAGIFGVVGLESLKSARHPGMQMLGVALGTLLILGVAVPLGAFVRVYLGAGIDHLLLRLFGGRAPFDATLRAYCYSMSPAVFGLLPGCGLYIWEIWRLVCCVFAYRSLHGISGFRAAAAVLSPLLLCCGGYVALTAAVAAAGPMLHAH